MFSQVQQILVTRHDEVGPGSDSACQNRVIVGISGHWCREPARCNDSCKVTVPSEHLPR